MSKFSIEFLTRDGCHLCDEARPVVERAASRAGARIEEVDIDGSDELTAIYGLRIPVVLAPDDSILAEGIIEDVGSLRKEIRRAKRSAARRR